MAPAAGVRVFDLTRASRAFYSVGLRLLAVSGAVMIILLGLPLTLPDSLRLLRGLPLPGSGWAIYLAVVCAAYPAMAFVLWVGFVGMAPRPVRMTLAGDCILLEAKNGHGSEIRWDVPRFRMVLLDQSKYVGKVTGDPSIGFRLDGLIAFRAILTREAFDALLDEARTRGCTITSAPAPRWSVSASTPGTLVYRVERP